jgi:hypothetical protein
MVGSTYSHVESKRSPTHGATAQVREVGGGLDGGSRAELELADERALYLERRLATEADRPPNPVTPVSAAGRCGNRSL